MSFIETQFPADISNGVQGGPEYSTDIVVVNSGFESRNINWSVARGRWDVSHGVKTPAQADALIAFFRAVKGSGHGFRFKDWSDYQATVANGRLGTGAVGTGLAAHQMKKRYTAGSLTEDRDINKPVSGTVAVQRNGSAVTVGAGAGQIAIDYTTGTVTFVADATANVSAVTVGASTVVTLASALAGLTIGGKLFLSGLGGTVGATLNGLAHSITNIAGAVYTLSVTTTGLAYTSGGTGQKFPQPTDTLTWSGEFDVPARFDSDRLQMERASVVSYNWQQIPIVEIRV